MPWLYRTSIQHPRTVIAIALGLTLAVAPGMWRLTLRTDGHALIPADAPAIQIDRSIRGQFGIEDLIVVLIEAKHPDGIFNVQTLELIKSLTTDFQKMEGVNPVNVSSLATEASDRMIPGTLKFQKLLDPLPSTPSELRRLREDLEAIRLYTGTVASANGRAAAIFVGVPAGASRSELARRIRERIDARGPLPDTVRLTGAPIAEALLGAQILDDLGVPDRLLGTQATAIMAPAASSGERPSAVVRLRDFIARHVGLVPITIVIMAGVFLVSFRSLGAALLPLMEVGACLVVVFGLMGWFGVPVYLTIAILPVILTVTGVTDEVHVYSRYFRMLRERIATADGEWRTVNCAPNDQIASESPFHSQSAIRNPPCGFMGQPHAQAVRDTMDEMWRPILQTAVTTAVGFLSFAISPIQPVQAFGIWAGIGSLFCMLWSMSVIPAQLVLLGPRIASRVESRASQVESGRPGGPIFGLSRLFERLGAAVVRYRYAALALAGLLVALTPLGLRRLHVQDSWIDGFHPASSFRQATRVFNEQFLGAHILQVCVEAHQPSYRGELDPSAVDREFIRLPADVAADPASLIGYQITLVRERPIVITTGPGAGQRLPVQWLSWVIGASREGDRLVLTTSQNRGLPSPVLRLESGDRLRLQLEANAFATPAVLRKVEALEAFLARQRDVKVGGLLGPGAYLSTTRFMANARKESLRSIPDDPERIDLLWKQYSWLRGTERLRQAVDERFSRVLVTVFMNDANFVDTARLLERLRTYERAELAPHGLSLRFAGDVAVSQALIEAIVSTQVRSLLGSLVGVFLVTALLGRSLRWGLYCVLPCCVGVLLNFAVMGWVGVPLGVATSMFAAITLGIGVDYAIHLLERYQAALSGGLGPEAGLVEAVKATGPSVFIDAVAVSLGFGVMTLSQVPANARLGGLVVLNLLTCLAATLLVLPALLSIWRPRSPDSRK